MDFKIKLAPSFERKSTFYLPNDSAVPAGLETTGLQKPDLSCFPYPLPSKKSEYTGELRVGPVRWLAASTGLTRYEPEAAFESDIIQYFSATRDLADNEVLALCPDGADGVWVRTKTAVTHIEMIKTGAREKAELLREESLRYVDRRGMLSERYLSVPRVLDSRVPYHHSDNDGGFTAAFALGEMFRYAVLRREKGVDAPETKQALAETLRHFDACMLLCYICGRGDGFVARTCQTRDEPIPDAGIFFRRQANGKAKCLVTTQSVEEGMAGVEVDCSHPIPERFRKPYTDLGYDDDDMIFKTDTSSDEITLHLVHLYFANEILVPDCPEIAPYIKETVSAIVGHIVDHGFRLCNCLGRSTTWAKWNEEYFNTPLGWPDGPLNCAEMLSYLLIASAVTGEVRWEKVYKELLERGYADTMLEHGSRYTVNAKIENVTVWEYIMYGDHMLATCAHWMLCLLEKDADLRALYEESYRQWRTSMAREHNACYDLTYLLSVPGAENEVDAEALAVWFRRTNLSNLTCSVRFEERHDVAVTTGKLGDKAITTLLPPDERSITKYDRNPFCDDPGSPHRLESCYTYTFAYWLGKYSGLIED
ncbi:MAG: hypothetical protein K6C36_00720 [Clostridia bacterium]|nr:hypothetical protein [Clostridia bacterium]